MGRDWKSSRSFDILAYLTWQEHFLRLRLDCLAWRPLPLRYPVYALFRHCISTRGYSENGNLCSWKFRKLIGDIFLPRRKLRDIHRSCIPVSPYIITANSHTVILTQSQVLKDLVKSGVFSFALLPEPLSSLSNVLG